jgi:hypothetical protein
MKRTPEMKNRMVQFHFHYPTSVYGIYDTGDGAIYIFGKHCDGEIEDVLNHEVLHWTVQKIAGEHASLELDNVPKELLRI